MRQLSRPLRALDPKIPLRSIRQPYFSPSRIAGSTPAAAFSSSSSNHFLLPGKQDKKKHQQFVRRWQKRLLGDSEPIGAHVDPYDPTSPVRIAPEEQGEYEEILDDSEAQLPRYDPAEEGRNLIHVGGDQWLRQKMEGDLAKEFEKLTLRTYTPLSLDMANAIEDLTGTPYTLKDENLMLAQNIHSVTGKPYTEHNFGLHRKVTAPKDLRRRFMQAVAEIFTLKNAGENLDMSALPNRGVYAVPKWLKDIEILSAENGEVTFQFPENKNADNLLRAMRESPEWSIGAAEDAELSVEEPVETPGSSLAMENHPVMSPETPAFKRQAVVKMDSEKKPFDFMSNRPVPRVATLDDVKPNIVQESAQEFIGPEQSEIAPVVEASRSTAEEMQQPPTKDEQQRSVRSKDESISTPPRIATVSIASNAKWQRVNVEEPVVKFALFKRVLQLTGVRISDTQLSKTKTLGDLYEYLCEAAKPQPATLFSALHVQGQKAREQAKRASGTRNASYKKAGLGELIHMGNVELRRTRLNNTEKRRVTGLDKVVRYALWERGLGRGKASRSVPTGRARVPVLEGTREVPDFGKPMSGNAANYLAAKSQERREQQRLT